MSNPIDLKTKVNLLARAVCRCLEAECPFDGEQVAFDLRLSALLTNAACELERRADGDDAYLTALLVKACEVLAVLARHKPTPDELANSIARAMRAQQGK